MVSAVGPRSCHRGSAGATGATWLAVSQSAPVLLPQVEEGASFAGISRPTPNPLHEDLAVSPTPEARQRLSEPHAA